MNAVLNKNESAEKLWERKTAEMNEYLNKVCPDFVGYPDFFPESVLRKNIAEKIFNADFELDWIPKGLRLLDLKKDLNLFYEYQTVNAPDSSPRGDLATIPWPLTDSKRERGREIRHARYYWWGGQKFASEPVGGYWVLWFPDIYCLNQPASIQKGPCEVFAKQIFELSEKAGMFPHITELVYLLLLHKHRVPEYAKDANFIGNFVRSGTQSYPNSAEQNNLLLAAGWKLSLVSENSDIKLMLNIDDFPFHAAFKNVGAVPFVKLSELPSNKNTP